jgi:DNA-directed RNA polymerase
MRQTSFWCVCSIVATGYLPQVQMDAKCSGFQHLAILLRDINLGRLVGIGPVIAKNDLYTTVGLSFEELIFNKEKLYDELLSYFTKFNVDLRQFSKKPVVTAFFGGSTHGIADSILANNPKTD